MNNERAWRERDKMLMRGDGDLFPPEEDEVMEPNQTRLEHVEYCQYCKRVQPVRKVETVDATRWHCKGCKRVIDWEWKEEDE